ncbi:MAG: XdhC/CoxI family protein [Gemmatimonadales bacterium]
MSDERTRSVSAEEAARQALAALDGGSPTAIVTVVTGPSDGSPGQRLIVDAETVRGSFGMPELEARAVALARQVTESGECRLHQVEHEGDTWELFIEPVSATPELVIVGAGHIARPLCRIAVILGFNVVVLDDRAEFASESWFPDAASVRVVDFNDAFRGVPITPFSYVVLVTRGHKYDYDCILQLLRLDVRPAYLGMIGSRRRVRATFEALVRDGVATDRLADVRAPIGLDIGAETPEEIALAIAAEIVAVRRGGSGNALTVEERVLARIDKKVRPQRGRE